MTSCDRCIAKLDLIIGRTDGNGIRTRGMLDDIRDSNRRLRFHMNIWALAMAALIIIGVPLTFARMLG